MSLTRDETETTSRELTANLALTGLSEPVVAADLGWSAARLEHTLAVDRASDPVDAWELRDYLEGTVHKMGKDGVPFGILTEANRLRARGWFSLREARVHPDA